MGTITGQQIADRAWTKLNEVTGSGATRWTPAEALMWINDGQREIVTLLPRANTVLATPLVVAGTRQTLDGLGLTSGLHVVDVLANYTSAGVRGRPITKIARSHLDELRPSWASDVWSEAQHWVEDERDPKAFHIWPATYGAGGRVGVLYPALPSNLSALSGAISLGDEYAQALQWWLLASFLAKDQTFAKSPQLAMGYLQLFQSALGMRGQSIAGNSAATTNNARGN